MGYPLRTGAGLGSNLLGVLVASHGTSQLDEAGDPYYLDKLDRRQYLFVCGSVHESCTWGAHFIIATFVASFPLRKSQPLLFYGSLIAVNGDFSGLARFDRGGERIDAGDDHFTHALGDDSALPSDQPAGVVIP